MACVVQTKRYVTYHSFFVDALSHKDEDYPGVNKVIYMLNVCTTHVRLHVANIANLAQICKLEIDIVDGPSESSDGFLGRSSQMALPQTAQYRALFDIKVAKREGGELIAAPSEKKEEEIDNGIQSQHPFSVNEVDGEREEEEEEDK